MAPVAIVVAFFWLMISCTMLFSSIRTEGKVVQSIESGSGTEVIYIPVFVFRDSAGIDHTNRASGGSNPPRFPVGRVVSVLYRANNPDAGMIEDRLLLWFAPVMLLGLGIFYGSIGIAIDRWLQKKGIRNAE